MQKQSLDKLQTRKMKGLKAQKRKARPEEGQSSAKRSKDDDTSGWTIEIGKQCLEFVDNRYLSVARSIAIVNFKIKIRLIEAGENYCAYVFITCMI